MSFDNLVNQKRLRIHSTSTEEIIDSAQTLDAQVRGRLDENHPELYTGA